MSGNTVDIIYSEYYQTEKYQSLWFTPNDKPLIIGITENNNNASDQTKYDANFNNYLSKEMQEFFDVKESEWPNGDFNPNSIPWMSWEYPQKIHNGSIAVPVAQHSHSAIIASIMHPESSRGYNNVTGGVEENYHAGRSFQDMWDTVHENDKLVNNVLVTSFNEWMAIKQTFDNYPDPVQFVDVFSEEYSRDIEMMKGGYNDNFFLQMVSNIRKYKYTEPVKYEKKQMNMNISNPSSLVLWDYVTSHYKDFAGDAIKRDFINAVNTGRYIDESNRNDITDIKVVHDKKNLYFYIKTLDDITEYNGSDVNWMNIFIKTNETNQNFAGYQYVVNRSPNSNLTSLEKSLGGYEWEKVGDVMLNVSSNIMQVAIPLSLLDLDYNDVNIEFKVADNVTNYEDIMDYYVTGDVAPLGRLNYAY
jgi:hypothetical protein